jgi:hypothetical protein
VFSAEQRGAVRDRVVELAAADERVVAGALVGSLAVDGGDRWADLDLTFATRDDVRIEDVLDDLSASVVSEFSAVHLFDLPSGAAIYRVLLLPGCLQFDLSAAPASGFRLVGPKVRLLFGEAPHVAEPPPPPAETDFGYAVHHVVRARFCIERGRYWQAEYWISAARDLTLAIACRRHDVERAHGRGFDRLPRELLDAASDSLVRSPERKELLRALGATIELLLGQADSARELADQVEPQLRLLTESWA